ncbi:hypothetical protein BJ912DRAFT_176402 [Pholiota molesta]|nr:hypothetical protein BJ912DRAFT_176402 [Pholiota molesta]
MKAEFDAFFLDRLSKYPSALRTHIPTILALLSTEGAGLNRQLGILGDVIRLLLFGFTEFVAESHNIRELDSTFLNLATHKFTINTAFTTLFQDKFRAGEYYVCDRSYLALANQIIKTIFPRPGGDNRQIKFEQSSWDPNEQVLYLKDGSLHLQLYSLEFIWFQWMLQKTPQDLDLATLLHEHALHYDEHDIELKIGQKNIARGSLEYIQRCGIPYVNHVHLPGAKKCIVCDKDQPDAAAFLQSRPKLGVPLSACDVDEILALCLKLEALSLSDLHEAEAETRGIQCTECAGTWDSDKCELWLQFLSN